MFDRRLLVIHGAPLHAANVSDQPALSDASDMGPGVPCDVASVSGLVLADAAAALARSTIPVGASETVAQSRDSYIAEWTSGAGAYLAAANR